MMGRSTRSAAIFRERMHPPWWCWVTVFVWVTLGAGVVGIGDTWLDAARNAAVVTLFLGAFSSLIVLQVTERDIVTARRAGGRRLPVDEVIDHRLVTGPALREVRNRLTPSFRLHCPLWYRCGVQLITLDDEGRRVEHLYGVRDAAGFLSAIGAPEGSVTHHEQRGVPL